MKLKKLLVMALLCCAANTAWAEEIKNWVPDYKLPSNWAYQETQKQAQTPVDLFYITSVTDMTGEQGLNVNVTNPQKQKVFLMSLHKESSPYVKNVARFVPYYRQVAFPVYKMEADKAKPYFDVAYEDVRNSFLHYLKKYNHNRPVIIAGFSHGSHNALRLLQDPKVYKNKALQKNLVAVYAIGWRLTQEEVDQAKKMKNPLLKPAQGELDTGTIITYNTEAPMVTDSIFVPKGMKTLAINPYNWKTDSTAASKKMNLGACFIDVKGQVQKEEKNLTGGYLDEKRGTLKLPYINPTEYSLKQFFNEGVYHVFDYQFTFRNLEKNVEDRTQAYLKQRAVEPKRK